MPGDHITRPEPIDAISPERRPQTDSGQMNPNASSDTPTSVPPVIEVCRRTEIILPDGTTHRVYHPYGTRSLGQITIQRNK